MPKRGSSRIANNVQDGRATEPALYPLGRYPQTVPSTRIKFDQQIFSSRFGE
jgi:hypothetical protein